MKTLSYFIEPCAELMLALNILTVDIHAQIDWHFSNEEEFYIEVTIVCYDKDAAYVEKMIAPFV
jgi:hypothetical protein